MNNKEKYILILSHCGYSFVEDIASLVHEMGLRAIVLSSHFNDVNQDRLNQLKEMADEYFIAKSSELSMCDVNNILDYSKNEKISIIACISVWEGYRSLMAVTNQMLGANDLDIKDVELLRDKYELRKHLIRKGISKINVDLLTKETIHDSKNKESEKFIKPRFGIASYGAFKLKSETEWGDIVRIKKEISDDNEYKSVFNENIDFIIEDYIYGNEYSFEIIVYDKNINLIAVHEKVEVNECEATVLESACVSPPINLNIEEIDNVLAWLTSVFNELDIHTGCFHLEAKYNGNDWEIIEINPRVGGAYIIKSCEILTGGINILSLWIESLITISNDARKALLAKLNRCSLNNVNNRSAKTVTYFRVFFAKDTGCIKSIEINPIEYKPTFMKTIARPGQCINGCSREVFIGQALWAFPYANEDQMKMIISASNELFEVSYV